MLFTGLTSLSLRLYERSFRFLRNIDERKMVYPIVWTVESIFIAPFIKNSAILFRNTIN